MCSHGLNCTVHAQSSTALHSPCTVCTDSCATMHSHWMLWLEYFSDIPQTSGRTPDVQLCAIDATLCIIRHLAPNLGECPDVFLFCYNSNISLISCGHPTLRNGHGIFALSDNSCPTWPSSPMVSLFVTIQIFLWYTADVRSDSGCPTLRNGCGVFVLSDNSCPTRPSVPMFSLS